MAQLDYMEKRGSGLKKICNATKELESYKEERRPVFKSSSAQFMRDLIKQAMVITICREPDFCGGIGGIAGSNYNLQNLDNYFFEGQLGTNLLF